VRSFWTNVLVKVIIGYPLSYEHIAKDATAFETTVAFPSFKRFYKSFKNPCSSIKDGEISYSFGTHKAPVFLTYGSSSRRAFFNGSHKYYVISLILIHPIVLTAKARKNGLDLSTASLIK
jgi:hypothetical protein